MWLLLFFAAFLAVPEAAQAQVKPRVVQLTGLVTAGDSLYGVIGASVYVPKTGRGTTTNRYGYFSMPVLTGDSVVFRALGYQPQHVVIPPAYTGQSWSVIIELSEDVSVLPEVRVFPYPTEQLFKEAFLALKLETDEESNAKKNLHEKVLRQMLSETGMDASTNHSNYMNVYLQDMQRKQGGLVVNPLMNPFAWLQVIESIKRGDFKRKE